jgi:hypothetical protein
MPRSPIWDSLFPSPNALASTPNEPAYTSRYRHLLNIRQSDNESDESDELQRYRSVVDKEWTSFKETGFRPPDEKKLMFDLNETERAGKKTKHTTMDWSESHLPFLSATL